MSPPFPKISIGTSEIDLSSSAKNLGVVFDKSMHMKAQVRNLVRAASFHIGRLRRYLDRPSVERLVHAFVSSRLDSCNALLYGLLDKDIAVINKFYCVHGPYHLSESLIFSHARHLYTTLFRC